MNILCRGQDGKTILMKQRKDNLYKIKFTKEHGADTANVAQSSKKDVAFEIWYCCFGHSNVKSVCTIQIMVDDQPWSNFLFHIFIGLYSVH